MMHSWQDKTELTLQVRIPREIHERLVAEAKDRMPPVSLNQEIVERLVMSFSREEVLQSELREIETRLKADVVALLKKEGHLP